MRRETYADVMANDIIPNVWRRKTRFAGRIMIGSKWRLKGRHFVVSNGNTLCVIMAVKIWQGWLCGQIEPPPVGTLIGCLARRRHSPAENHFIRRRQRARSDRRSPAVGSRLRQRGVGTCCQSLGNPGIAPEEINIAVFDRPLGRDRSRQGTPGTISASGGFARGGPG